MRRTKPPASGAVIFYGSRLVLDNKLSASNPIAVVDPLNAPGYPKKVGLDGMHSVMSLFFFCVDLTDIVYREC